MLRMALAWRHIALGVMADVVLGCRKFRGGRYYIGTAKIAERMVFIAMNAPVHVNCIELHPLALVLTGSQSEAGSAHTCNPSLSSLESQTRSNNFDIKRQMETVEANRTTRTRTRSLSIPLKRSLPKISQSYITAILYGISQTCCKSFSL